MHKGLVAPFDMNVGVLHGQCLGEFTHFDSIIPDPELYEKAKQMPAIVAAQRNVADGAGDVVGVRYGRFTKCRIWFDCASELWALEQKHAAIEKEVTAAENARDRASSDIRRVEYVLDRMQSGMMDAKFQSNLSFLQARPAWKKTLKKITILKGQIQERQRDEEELKDYKDPKEREIARQRILERREKERIELAKEMGEYLPDLVVSSPNDSKNRNMGASARVKAHNGANVAVEEVMGDDKFKRRNAFDDGKQPVTPVPVLLCVRTNYTLDCSSSSRSIILCLCIARFES